LLSILDRELTASKSLILAPRALVLDPRAVFPRDAAIRTAASIFLHEARQEPGLESSVTDGMRERLTYLLLNDSGRMNLSACRILRGWVQIDGSLSTAVPCKSLSHTMSSKILLTWSAVYILEYMNLAGLGE
jgi:hypothetical protein